ncbi:unnamed protein product [Medioppia subpectinata]|uniref:Calcineurin-like phosphoesterase domain-containing protein n=1 Tax=Medioppia subpectinata TaxID=1979941 RepID=A0A7R9KHY8_9ACAR|nr:unnamed protein product [Medioppia subpectinata]CAG2104025.1 unnamed protein product [Medioppia subpectinata]
MKRLIAILAKSKHRFIVSKGVNHNEYDFPDNMWGDRTLPQIKVLPIVDLMITHGGNNSTTETMYFGKPMIVLPLIQDQYDNAQRVMEKGTYAEDNDGEDLNGLIAPDIRAEVEATITIDELGKMFNELLQNIEGNRHNLKACQDCNTSITFGRMLVQSPDLIKSLAPTICKSVTYSTRVCVGMLERMSEPLATLFQRSKITTPEMCATLLSPDCMTLFGLPFTHNINWVLPLPKPKPFAPKVGSDKQLKMVHLTDAHLDLWYTPGSNSTCSEPVCCRSTSPGDNSHRAGYWSQTKYSCDCPLNFAQNSIQQIGDKHKDIDLVIWTGDNIPHDVWNTTKEVNIQHIRAMTDAMKKAFADKPLFPCLGNHEAHPINLYVPNSLSIETQGKVSMGWLYDTLADDLWSQWIDTAEAKKTFKKGGYYSKRFSDKLKVVVMNNNVCQHENYYIAYDPIDPDGQLQWLIDELDRAETIN